MTLSFLMVLYWFCKSFRLMENGLLVTVELHTKDQKINAISGNMIMAQEVMVISSIGSQSEKIDQKEVINGWLGSD